MAQFKFRALGVRHTKFIDEFFPKSIANPAPKVTTNPFTNLRCANTPKMKEAQIAKIFVSKSTCSFVSYIRVLRRCLW